MTDGQRAYINDLLNKHFNEGMHLWLTDIIKHRTILEIDFVERLLSFDGRSLIGIGDSRKHNLSTKSVCCEMNENFMLVICTLQW